MPTGLNKPLIRDTGLTRDGKSVIVALVPTPAGGNIVFKEKGKRGKGIEVTLAKVMEDAAGIKRTPVGTPQDLDSNLVDLGTLESRIMIDGEGVLSSAVKGRLWAIVREIREERREDLGLPPVFRGSERSRKI